VTPNGALRGEDEGMTVRHRTSAFDAAFGSVARVLGAGAFGLAIVGGSPAVGYAQDAGGAPTATESDEIVVTARRREELEQDVPMSMTVIGQEDLTSQGVRTIADLPSVAPGLSTGYTAGRRNDLTFSQRGQGQPFGGSAPGVATYFADVPDFASQIYDLSSVAVLKGPQGTLFGRNTTGGAVLLTPARPEDEWGGYLTGRVGDFERRDAEFGVTGPLGDNLAVRLSGQYLSREGYAINLFDGSDVANENKFSLRGAVLWQVTPNIENYTILQYARTAERGADNQIRYINTLPAIASPFNPALAPPGTIDYSVEGPQVVAEQLARGPRVINVDGGHYNYFRSDGVINTTTIDLSSNLTLKNIFSWREYDDGQTFDFDGSPLPIANTYNPIFETTQKTEEIQVQWRRDGFELTAGYYYEDRDTPNYTQFDFTTFWPYPTGAFGPLPEQGVYHAVSFDVFAHSRSQAVYAETTFGVTDRLNLTFGVRQTHDEREGGNSTAIATSAGTLITASVKAGEAEFDATTWNASAVFQATDDFNLYASIRRGYKAGGVNTTTTGDGLIFDPEYVTDYEIGAKYAGFVGDWRVSANVDIFYDDYSDIQRNVVLPGAVVATQTENAAAATITGADIQLRVSPNEFLDLGLAYTFVDAGYDAYSEPVFGDLSKSIFPQTPEHQVNFDVRVAFPIPEEVGELSMRADVYYQSKTAFVVTNTLNGTPANDLAVPTSVTPDYTLVNLRADWDNVMQSNLGIGVFVTNATDEEYIIGNGNLLNGPSFASTYSYGAPRMWGVELRYKF